MIIKTEIDFSLIIPTRERVELLKKCLSSYFTRAHQPNKVEALLICDHDDKTMRNFSDFILENNFNVKIIHTFRSELTIRDYNNYGSQCSTGRFIWMLNDDFEVITDHWDKLISQKAEQFLTDKPDRIAYIMIDDNTHTNWGVIYQDGCCCPIVSRETVEAQNGIMPEEINSWGGDMSLYWIFKSLPEKRILDLTNDIKTLHHSWHNGSRERDNLHLRVEKISKKSNLNTLEMTKYTKALSDCIIQSLLPINR